MPRPQGTRALSHLSTALLCPGTLRTPGQSAEHDASIQGGHQPAGDGQTLSDAPTSSGRPGSWGAPQQDRAAEAVMGGAVDMPVVSPAPAGERRLFCPPCPRPLPDRVPHQHFLLLRTPTPIS